MKKKFKIIIPLLVFLLIGIFIKNTVSADTYTHSYINPNRSIDNVNAATYAFYNMVIPAGEYSYYESSIQKSFDTHLKILTFQDFGEYTEYSQLLIYFDESTISKVLYNDYYYVYFQKYRYSLKKYRQNNNTKEMENPGGLSSSTLTGSSSFSYYHFGLKLKYDYTSLSFNQQISSNISTADQLAVTGFSSSSWCYSNFYEVTSTINLLGETFQNNADIQNPSYNGTVLSDKQAFINWIIDNEKYVVFGDYGIENTAQFVDDIVNLYERFNKNPLSLFVSVPQFLIKNGSVFATVDKAKELINYVSALYQEFKLERRPVIYEPDLFPYIFPQPWIDDEPNEKYVDVLDDSVEIGLLREILRAIIVTPQNMFNFIDYYLFNISSNVSLLADYVAQTPTYMTELLYYRFAPLFSDSGGFDTSELQDFLLYLFNPTYDSFDEIDIILKDKFDLTELEQFLLLEDSLNQNLLNENDTELIPLNTVGEGGESGTETIYPSFKFTLPISNLTKVPLEIKLIDFDKFSIAITAFKGIFSVVIIFFFIRWLIRFFPKVLSGY